MFQNLALSPSELDKNCGLRGYTGPERRAAAAGQLGLCMTRMLDEIDYGMVLVSADAQVAYLNHAARLELDGEHPLQMLGSALRAQRPQDVAPLHDALASAQRGLRRLVMLGAGTQRVSISVVPLPGGGQDAHAAESADCAHGGRPPHEGLRPTTLLARRSARLSSALCKTFLPKRRKPCSPLCCASTSGSAKASSWVTSFPRAPSCV